MIKLCLLLLRGYYNYNIVVNNYCSNTTDISNQSTASFVHENQSSINLECSDGFYFDENRTELCRPICREFIPIQSLDTWAILDKVSIIQAGVVCAAIFITAVTVKRHTL